MSALHAMPSPAPTGPDNTITIRVYKVVGVDCVVARGFLPSGQNFIEGAMRYGVDDETVSAAADELVAWVRRFRPTFAVAVDGAP